MWDPLQIKDKSKFFNILRKHRRIYTTKVNKTTKIIESNRK